jgi:hypothetical protein
MKGEHWLGNDVAGSCCGIIWHNDLGDGEKQAFVFRSDLLYSDVSNRNVPKMKQNSVQTTASFQSNLWRHICSINRIHSTMCVSGLRFVLEKCHSFCMQYGWLRSTALQKCSYYGYDVNHTLNITIFNSRNIKKHTVEDSAKWDDACVWYGYRAFVQVVLDVRINLQKRISYNVLPNCFVLTQSQLNLRLPFEMPFIS